MPVSQTLWVNRLRKDPEWSKIRFKKLDTGYPPFDIVDGLVDVVCHEEFLQAEPLRLPLFIGTQFGIFPYFSQIPGLHDERRVIAILGKSMLSGHVSGLSIYRLEEKRMEKIVSFRN